MLGIRKYPFPNRIINGRTVRIAWRRPKGHADRGSGRIRAAFLSLSLSFHVTDGVKWGVGTAGILRRDRVTAVTEVG